MVAQGDQAASAQAQRELEAARARWRANAVASYRLRVSSFNPLNHTVTETDVKNGSIVAARRSSGMPGLHNRPNSESWGPFDGETVETLFQMIQRHLQDPGEKRGGRVVRDVVGAVYDKRLGYPMYISIGPPASERIMDADVSFKVELMESPAAPLIAPSPGEAYQSPVSGRILDPLDAYNSLFGFGSDATARIVRRVWPGRADEIISRGASPHWRSVGWTPKAGLVGSIIGTLALSSGAPVYVMEFTHDRGTVFLLIEKHAVQVIK